MVSSRPSAAAAFCGVVSVALVPPASRRATAAWLVDIRTASSSLAESGRLAGFSDLLADVDGQAGRGERLVEFGQLLGALGPRLFVEGLERRDPFGVHLLVQPRKVAEGVGVPGRAS